jgi:hypothetical protein
LPAVAFFTGPLVEEEDEAAGLATASVVETGRAGGMELVLDVDAG